MNFYKKLLIIFFIANVNFVASPCYASLQAALIKKISFDDFQNIEVFVNQKTTFKAYLLHNPERLVVDVDNANFATNLELSSNPEFVAEVRRSKFNQSSRIVFDLNSVVKIKSSLFQKLKKEKSGKILVKIGVEGAVVPKVVPSAAPTNSQNVVPTNLPKGTSGNSLAAATVVAPKVVPAAPKKENSLDDVIANVADAPTPSTTTLQSASKPKVLAVIDKKNGQVIEKNEAKKTDPKKIPIIAIDAGHGGKDPGTIGDYANTKEKNITLAYARELAKHLNNSKNYKVYLIRNSDEFVPLKRRVEKARRLNADLFISLHANSAADRSVSGLSIYTLSEKSSDKQAELLAQKENRADIIAGINFGDTSGDILKTLIDLSQRSSMNSSSQFANIAILSTQKSGVEILHNTHRFAGFMVLTAPDMTSVLIELGYLSNKYEEEKLNSFIYRRTVVKGLVDAVDQYFRVNR